jgi:hypothetical protein
MWICKPLGKQMQNQDSQEQNLRLGAECGKLEGKQLGK